MRGESVLAIHVLTYLAHNQSIISSSELARNTCAPAPRIRKIMRLLKQAGIVYTSAGATGGYQLAKPACNITVADCMCAIKDQPVAVNWFSGDVDNACMISSGMHHMMESLQQDLNTVCFKRLAKISIADIEAGLVAKHS